MNRTEKQETVESLGEQFRSIDSAFLLDYKGLKVVELRRKIRDIHGHYLVVKNTLALRAVKDTGLEPLRSHFEGPTAIAYHPKDVIALAKLLSEVTKTNPNLQCKAAQVLASLPPREVMIGKLMFVLRAPLQRLATVLQAPLRDLALVLKQVEK